MALAVYNGLDLQAQRIQNMADPSSATDAATKQYVDNNLAGLRWKQPVRVATTTSGTLSSDFANGSSVDGKSLVTGDRILIKNQTTKSENGIYVVKASGTPDRAADADAYTELLSATVLVAEGTANHDLAFTQTEELTSLSSDQTWVQFGGGSAYTADENGIHLASGVFSIKLDGTTLQTSGSGLRIGSGAAGNGLGESSGVLAVNTGTASATGLEISSDIVRIASAGLTTGLTGGSGSAIGVDYSVVQKRVAANVGDGSSTSIAVTHGLGTRDVSVEVYRNSSPWDTILCDVERNSTSQITLKFATAPASNAYRVVIG